MSGYHLTERIPTRVERDLKRKLESIAKREGVPTSQVVRRACRAYVEKETKK